MEDKNITLSGLSKEVDDIFNTFMHESFDVRQKGLQAGAEVFVKALEVVTPFDSKNNGVHMRDSWKILTKYKDKRYVGNTRLAKGAVRRKDKNGKTVKNEAREGVPLSNVLEYSKKSPHYGFIRRCFDNNVSAIYAAIKSKIEKGDK